jgi:ribosomal protein S3
MGQKVHPVGFRVGISKPYQSQWFAPFHKYQYSQTVFEDYILRQTLLTLFPKLLNPKANNSKKRDEKTELSPKITHIKIERGIIPYQIGIQVHAENCDIIKSAIENLTVSTELQAKLQKIRHYLILLQKQTKVASDKETLFLKNENEQKTLNSKINKNSENVSKGSESSKITFRQNSNFRKNNSKNFLNSLQKKNRVKARRLRTKSRFIALQKKNFSYNATKLTKSLFNKSSKKNIKTKASQKFVKNSFKSKITTTRSGLNKKRTVKDSRTSFAVLAKKIRKIAVSSSNQTAKKIFNIFLTKTQNKFFTHLKEQLKYWREQSVDSPFGSNKKWSLKAGNPLENNILNKLKNKSIYKLTKLVQRLEKKAFLKMERLRVDFISTGPLSKAQTFGYYQIITFLKHLKDYIIKQRTYGTYLVPSKLMKNDSLKNLESKNEYAFLPAIANQIKLANIDKEYTKIKFIEHLKDIIKKHRKDNIYYYLSSLNESKKNLRNIQKFTKRNASFLFNVDLKNEKPLNSQIKESLEQPTVLQEVFIKQIEKQKKINQENITLTPKISIKFYNAPSNVIDTKATIVADTVVDALEKRQAFRKVIKQAMSEAIKNPRVKGVKIQVAGRLNGAEIARTEWVRSGRVPLQTLNANIDYAYKTANTIYGIIGIKVWLFKGYVKTS